MRITAFLFIVGLALVAATSLENIRLHQKLEANPKRTWKMVEPSQMKSNQEMKKLLGGHFSKPQDTTWAKKDFPRAMRRSNALPTNFNATQKWPQCVHPIRAQNGCGSCWSFAASEYLSDAFCIASNGTINHVLSAQDMVSCNVKNYGCNGGFHWNSFWYLENYGLVSDKCFPYTSGDGSNEHCIYYQCKDQNVSNQRFRCQKNSTIMLSEPEAIKAYVFEHGPMEIGFIVYEDFKAYKGGVYQHLEGNILAGHFVKLVGFGEEKQADGSAVPYWIIANSWGPEWGEEGFFRIKHGDSGIDNEVWACNPDLHNFSASFF